MSRGKDSANKLKTFLRECSQVVIWLVMNSQMIFLVKVILSSVQEQLFCQCYQKPCFWTMNTKKAVILSRRLWICLIKYLKRWNFDISMSSKRLTILLEMLFLGRIKKTTVKWRRDTYSRLKKFMNLFMKVQRWPNSRSQGLVSTITSKIIFCQLSLRHKAKQQDNKMDYQLSQKLLLFS